MAQILGLPKLSPTMEEGVLVRWTKKEGDKVAPGDLIAEVETDKANMDFNVEDEGVLLKLLVKEGDTVRLGAPVAIIGNAGEDIAALLEQAKSDGAPAKAAPAKEAPKAAAKEAPKAAPAKAAPAKTAAAKPAAKAPAKAAPAPSPSPSPSPSDEAPEEAEGAEDSANAPAAKKAPREATKPEQDQGGKAAVKPAPSGKSAAPAGRLLASPLAKTLAIELGIDLRNVTGSGPGGRIVERDVKAAAEGGAQAEAPADAET
ncbi:MAG: biotin/lipoyl-containing protein, partial [Kofleriaceae bacterium]